MANTGERRFRQLSEGMDQEEDLFDLDLERTDAPERRIRAGKVVKSDLHLLAMIESDDCPIHIGTMLRYGYGGRTKTGLMGDAVIESYDRFVNASTGAVYRSLSAAASDITGRKKGNTSDGWALSSIDDPAKPGKMISLSAVFMRTWEDLGFTLEQLEDTEALAKEMFSRGMIDKETLSRHIRSERDAWQAIEEEDV